MVYGKGERMPIPHYVTETQTIRRILKNPQHRIIWSDHAEKQMRKRNITAPDVLNVLTKGQVTLEEYKADILWRVKGRDLDGQALEVQVAAFESQITIKIVTTF
jgi:hypothetical protein